MLSIFLPPFCLQSIDRVQKLEVDFFPVLAGELGSSIEAANEYQRRLDNFMPEFEVKEFHCCEVLQTHTFSILFFFYFIIGLLKMAKYFFGKKLSAANKKKIERLPKLSF